MNFKHCVISLILFFGLYFDLLCASDAQDNFLGCHKCQIGTSVSCQEVKGMLPCEDFIGTDAESLRVLCHDIAAPDSIAQESCRTIVFRRKPEVDQLIKTGKATPDAICKILQLCDPRN
uniref:Saposin B-type domain-containing protein n=1 Tax=Ditylenchus dipsaci TaxID=166011 RepID=A0A915D152_9BILA